jgi:hypothetical protein
VIFFRDGDRTAGHTCRANHRQGFSYRGAARKLRHFVSESAASRGSKNQNADKREKCEGACLVRRFL